VRLQSGVDKLYCIVVFGLGSNKRKFTILLSCSDDGLQQTRSIYRWLVKNRCDVAFDAEDESAGRNVLSWAEHHLRQAGNFHYFLFCFFSGIRCGTYFMIMLCEKIRSSEA